MVLLQNIWSADSQNRLSQFETIQDGWTGNFRNNTLESTRENSPNLPCVIKRRQRKSYGSVSEASKLEAHYLTLARSERKTGLRPFLGTRSSGRILTRADSSQDSGTQIREENGSTKHGRL